MNWISEIKNDAFVNELIKLSSAIKKPIIKKAVITKLADIEHNEDGDILYHSREQDSSKEKKQDPKNGYEMYTEDTASGNQLPPTQQSTI